jgi:hypothetical protein
MGRIVLSMAMLAALITPVALGQATPQDREKKRYAEEFKNLPAITAAIDKATRVVLYEGLPHQTWEAKALAQELKSQKTVKLHDFPFYQETLSLEKQDTKDLTALLTRAGSLRPFSGAKLCGGFHPDYCVEWHLGKEVYRVLICFGCHEVKLHGPKTSVYCDVEDKALAGLQRLLKPYRKNRPRKK